MNSSPFFQVSLTIRSPGQSRADDDISEEVAQDKLMAEDQGRYSKSIFKAALKPYRKVVGKARRWHLEHSFEGLGDTRLIATAEHAAYEAKMAAFRAAAQAEADVFVAHYDSHLQDERKAKGLAFRLSDYPSKEAIAGRFGFEWALMPVAAPDQFSAVSSGVSSQEAKSLKDKYEGMLQQATANAQRKVLETLLKLIQETAVVLADPEAPLVDSENKKGPVAKLREYLDRVPALNVTHDPLITQLAEQCQTQLILTTRTLKDSPFTRSKVGAEASAIVQAYQGGFGRKLSA